jgi:hypothetical protein
LDSARPAKNDRNAIGVRVENCCRYYGLKYRKSDVDRAHWTFSGRELWSEIRRLLADPEYTLNIPVIEGSQKGVEQLADSNVIFVTARRASAEVATTPTFLA